MEFASAPSITHTMKLMSKYRNAQNKVGAWPARRKSRRCMGCLLGGGGTRVLSEGPGEWVRNPARRGHLFQIYRAVLQLRLLGDPADGANGQVIGRIAFAEQVAP